ncbi:MAG: DUF2207 domain-containing protein [Microcystis sp. LE18-22.4A]|uniref:DUF2207 domain-containing protein n=1 Tax=Microcystis sp. LE18-22.4A TaxID=3016432 RepID=UPI0022BD85AF|nr:DUF2207 domain-containing protein [Microcystis sp. LE18-22.4A]MCZ8119893.1 DUF2207 domain-containing protein [Microcystis sp. LE18-22.4A]
MNKSFAKQIVLSLTALLFTLSVPLFRITAEELPFYWESINVDIEVQTTGDMLVTETQKYVFNSDYSNQRYRYIPLAKVDDIQDVTVQENDKIIPSKIGIENNQFWINWQHELNPPEAHTFVLKYRVLGGLQVDNENTQVYWKAIFADRKAPIQSAKVRVQLPELLAGKVFSFKNFGTAAIASQVNPTNFEFVATQPIQPQEELEIQIAFPSNILNLPQPRWQQGGPSQTPPDTTPSFLGWVLSLLFILPSIGFILGGGGGGGRDGGGGGGGGGG